MRYLLFLLALSCYGQTVVNGGRTFLGPLDASGATTVKPWPSLASVPGTCTVGMKYFNTADAKDYSCTATNTWTPIAAAGGSESTTAANSGATGASVLKIGTNVTARKAIGGTGITVTENTDDLTYAWSLLTTKGDLAVFSTVPARLPIGTNDYVLTADSTVPTGMAWKSGAASGGGKQVMDCYAAGTQVSSNSSYYCSNASLIGSAEANMDETVPVAFTVSKLRAYISTAGGATCTTTLQFRKNGVTQGSGPTITLPNSAAIGWYASDGGGTVAYAAEDRMSVILTQSNCGASSPAFRKVTWLATF